MPVLRTGPLPANAFTTGLSAQVDERGRLEGKAPAGAVIEVNNLTTLPTGSGVVEDGVEVARAGADGRFSAQLKNANAGDVLQVQVRTPGQPVTTALQLRIDAARTQFDPTAPMVRVDRLRTVLDGGTLSIATRTRQPVSEPDAVIRFKNARTGEHVDAVADVFGRIGDLQLGAMAGDRIEVLASDGSVSIDKVHASATLDVSAPPLPSQPAPLLKDSSFVKLLPLSGPLFLTNGPGFGRQGSIGNCPVPAACSAVAAVDVDAIKNLIRDNGNGTCTVTFHPANSAPVEIVVDDKVWGSGSRPKYGSADGTNERWFPLVEKAYAAWVGDYEVLGSGTSVGKVLGELTGRATREVWTNVSSVDDVWNAASRAFVDKLPMAAGTYGTSESARYRGTGVYANHAYSVLGAEEKNGQRLITLRNPWGSGAANTGRVGSGDTGVFQMKVEDFCQLFQVLNIS